jgi:hypothetical protein
VRSSFANRHRPQLRTLDLPLWVALNFLQGSDAGKKLPQRALGQQEAMTPVIIRAQGLITDAVNLRKKPPMFLLQFRWAGPSDRVLEQVTPLQCPYLAQ